MRALTPLTQNTGELIPTLGALFPRGGPVQDPVLTRSYIRNPRSNVRNPELTQVECACFRFRVYASSANASGLCFTVHLRLSHLSGALRYPEPEVRYPEPENAPSARHSPLTPESRIPKRLTRHPIPDIRHLRVPRNPPPCHKRPCGYSRGRL